MPHDPTLSRTDLTADCERCCGLCCIPPPFSASEDFAFDKGAGVECPHLAESFRCTIHPALESKGFKGCVAYDCYGAGQKVTQSTFAGMTWCHAPEMAPIMFDVFMGMRRVHELLMYLTEALKLEAARPLWGEIQHKVDDLERLSLLDVDSLRALDITSHKRDVDVLLQRVGELVRS